MHSSNMCMLQKRVRHPLIPVATLRLYHLSSAWQSDVSLLEILCRYSVELTCRWRLGRTCIVRYITQCLHEILEAFMVGTEVSRTYSLLLQKAHGVEEGHWE